MKRKIPVLLIPLLLTSVGTSHADAGPGCGLGQQVFAGQTGLAAHALAATTNTVFFANQLFGLSFDSLGCDGQTVVTAEFQRNVFVASNFDNIARDAAQGGGDHLQSLAAIMDIQASDTKKFYQLAQANFDSLFGEFGADDYEAWLDNLDSTLSTDPALSKYSQRVRGS